jgi:hypothetical protein
LLHLSINQARLSIPHFEWQPFLPSKTSKLNRHNSSNSMKLIFAFLSYHFENPFKEIKKCKGDDYFSFNIWAQEIWFFLQDHQHKKNLVHTTQLTYHPKYQLEMWKYIQESKVTMHKCCMVDGWCFECFII